ncbi:MAG: adenylosuccinate synthase, partial [Bacteriovoracaceae bacterium]|nr:adenylosuccinate synthase [Bacteriovoracaceae bacterium]
MQTVAIIGAQWGDEGKGKITDYLGEKCDIVVRYQGGNNAGHTIIVGNKKTILHLIPSGILHPHCVSIIGHGLVFDPESFLAELKEISTATSVTPQNLKISSQVSVISSYDKILDGCREMGDDKIGTTKRGIGPAYESKVSRRGLKLCDLANKDTLFSKLKNSLQEREVLFKNLYQVSYPSLEEETAKLYELGQKILPFACDTFSYLEKALREGKKILYEGAQGILLDIDYGTYPYVTSSNTSFGGIYTGAGCPAHNVEEIIGITKAYTTRVGGGPFPTEMLSDLGEWIQTKGHEFGATTGRKRRCGWLDLPLLKYAAQASNLTSLTLTKVDVLSGIQELKVCYAYEYQGKKLDCAYPGLSLSDVKPLYLDMKPFQDD